MEALEKDKERVTSMGIIIAGFSSFLALSNASAFDGGASRLIFRSTILTYCMYVTGLVFLNIIKDSRKNRPET